MKALILGSGAGGGFPQWNCNCSLCARERDHDPRLRARTQSSIAVSDDSGQWILLNASPDISQQIRDNPQLQPRTGLRDTPIRAVILLDAHLDHVAGLLSLREGPPIALYCTAAVMNDLTTGLRIVPALSSYCGVQWHPIRIDASSPETTFKVDGCAGLHFRAMALEGRAPPYALNRAGQVGDSIAVCVGDERSGRQLFYAPGLARVGERELRWMREASCVLVDGTFWRDDEMPAAGLGHKTARDMGHVPQCGSGDQPGMMAALDELPSQRKLLIHINNSNPILDEGSDERRTLERRGIEVTHDRMEIVV